MKAFSAVNNQHLWFVQMEDKIQLVEAETSDEALQELAIEEKITEIQSYGIDRWKDFTDGWQCYLVVFV